MTTMHAIMLTKYKYIIQYIPGKDMVLADRLSRFPSHKKYAPIEIHQKIQHGQFNSVCLSIIRGAIERDPVHATAYCLTLNGWPHRIQDVLCITHHFLSTRDELTIKEGLLLKGNKSHIPLELYKRTLLIYATATKASKRCNIQQEIMSIGLELMQIYFTI